TRIERIAILSSICWRSGVMGAWVGDVVMARFLLLTEPHRPPPLPHGKTSAQTRYLTTSTSAAQRLRALGQRRVAHSRRTFKPL
ncbi:hypothetical protein, partial [uncultured Sphingomonas sp.]|uniref:hypothetical protein n=1 Tax=uncultured Sphingomonas sp. TaxID=158754 RepID=UPI0025D73B05